MTAINIIFGILYIILGGACLFWPGMTGALLVWIAAGLLVVSSLISFVGYLSQKQKNAGGIVMSIIGLLLGIFLFVELIIDPLGMIAVIQSLLVYVLLICLFIYGLTTIIGACTGGKSGGQIALGVILGILLMVVAGCLLCNVLKVAWFETLLEGIVCAIGFITYGIRLICASYVDKKNK